MSRFNRWISRLPARPLAGCLALLLLCGCASRSGAPEGSPPYAPEEALRTFELEDGFRIELFAAEPLVADPVAMEIDEAGRLYVVEMHGYPLDLSGSGRVKLLEDTDGDGRPDRSTVFADSLTLPTGILRWKDGVLVTDAPDVLYLEDTDGDGRADVRRVVLTGFARSNPQHNLNSPVYGLDNWIYLAHEPAVRTMLFEDLLGDPGSEIAFPGRPEAARLERNANGRNVRFRPDTYELEALASRTQFGHTFDAWGRYLLVNNANHVFHEVMPARYLERNPDLLMSSAIAYIPDHGNAAEVFPITHNPEHQLLTDVGVITSACGITAYLADGFPEAYRGALFVAEPVHNLVHTDRLSEAGATFVASRMQEGREFLASTDSWFRPVNFYVGPDGALYLIDYYRQIIEHPEWMSDEMMESGALYNGTDRGRIYRIVPEGAPRADWLGRRLLGEGPPETLVAALEQPNIWWRRTAQRLLVDRQDAAAAPALERLAVESPRAEARLHALWTLEGLGRLTPALIERALGDAEAGVRENAIRLAELHLAEAPALADRLVALRDDPSEKVQYQLLLTLGALETPPAAQARRELLFARSEDAWMQAAALSAANLEVRPLYEAALARLSEEETPGRRALFERLGSLIGMRGRGAEVAEVLRRATAPEGAATAWWRAASLEGLAEGLRGKGSAALSGADRARLLETFLQSDAAPVRQAALTLLREVGLPSGSARQAALGEAVRRVQDPGEAAARRAEAIELLTLADASAHAGLLQSVVDPREPLPVQEAAVRGLGRVAGAEVGRFLLARWGTLTGAVRDEAVDAMMTDEARVPLLLDALEDGRVQKTAIGWGRSKRLMLNRDEALRTRARLLLAGAETSGEELLGQYAPALTASGDAARGAQVFARVCAACHQVGGRDGFAFGPDLATLRNRQAEFILADILQPNRSIADGYEQWMVTRNDGGVATGVVAEETPTTITLRTAGGAEQAIARREIASMEALEASAMPEGLDQQISVQEMADLLAFLKRTP